MGTTQDAAAIAGARSASDLAAWFAAAPPHAGGAERPFLLHGDRVWYVETGQVDVFTVRLRDGQPVGPRVHLLRATAGQTLIEIARAPGQATQGLLAVGAQRTELRAVSRAALDPAAHAQLLDAWIECLYAGLTGDERLNAVAVELPSGQITELPEGGPCRPVAEVAWITIENGEAQLLGVAGLAVGRNRLLPLSRRGWLVAPPGTRVQAVATADLSDPAQRWAGLEHLHDLVLEHADLKARTSEQSFFARMRQRRAHHSAILRDAFEQLVAGVNHGEPGPAAAVPSVADGVPEPMLAVCLLVGRALDIPIKNYPRVQGAPPARNPLGAILRASRVRSRQVALRGQWWREDNGPLVAVNTASKRPVALLRPKASGPYVLHDPVERTQCPVDAAVAQTLEPFAHSFYRPFPEARLRARDVLRFGLYGSRRDVAVLFGVALCGSLLSMIPAIATGMLFNVIIPGAQRSQLTQMMFVLLACAIAAALCGLAQGIALLRIEGRASAALQAAVWDRLLALPLTFFRPYTSGDLAVRAMAIDSMRQAVSGATVSALMGVILASGNFVLMFYYSWRMALWATLIIAALMIVAIAGSAAQLRPQRAAITLQSKTAGLVLQLLTGIAKIRVAAAEIPAFALWARRFGEQRAWQFRARSLGNWIAAFNAAVPVISSLILFSIATPLITERSLPTGDFLAFLAAFSSANGAMLGASVALLATLNTVPLYEQARPILDTPPEVDVGKIDPGVLTGDIEVQHAMFRYHEDGPLVLRDVSFRIRPGEFIAFVGPSGSGKSTLLRLLLGFEALEAGTIHYEGQEIGGIDVQAVRRQIGVVLQSGRLMSGDIFSNIAGSSGAPLRLAWDAARMAGLSEEIEAMPMGMHTVISEGGGTLSGGQRQRLLIARAIVSRPRILLFDEATSALDNRTQAIVSASLEKLQATRIVVAHRLSTIVNADRIIVVDRGRIVQSGTYSQLMREAGPFAELAKRQIV